MLPSILLACNLLEIASAVFDTHSDLLVRICFLLMLTYF